MAISIGASTIITDGLLTYYDPANPLNYTGLDEVEVLVVGAGGGGGGRHAGGGGGGAVIYKSSYKVEPGVNITVTVGNGGAAAAYGGRGGTGQDSVFGNITAPGGGGGGGYSNGGATVAGENSNASGGGGAGASGLPGGNGSKGTGTQGFGFDGGDPPVSGYSGGGGGGAGGAGQPAREPRGGRGGDGLPSYITGSLVYYGGGGGGAGNGNADLRGGPGGRGGGGRGTGAYNPTQGTPGTSNLGGGGGGSRDQAGTSGGSGVVIVRYPGPQRASGGNTIDYVSSLGCTVHKFTGSGTFTPFSSALINGQTAYGLLDFSGNSNHAIAANGPTFNSSGGGSIEFDGTNDNMLIPKTSIPFPSGDEITFCVWNYGIDLRQSSIIEARRKGDVATRPINVHLPWANGTVYWDTGGTPSGNRLTFTPSSAQYQGWHYWCFTLNAVTGVKNIYSDGVLRSTGSGYFNSIVESEAIRIGSYYDGLSTFHRGYLGMLQIYKKELTADEILYNFNHTKSRYGL